MKILTAFSFFILICLGYPHPYYVSVTQVHYNSKTNSLECATKVFSEDLFDSIEQHFPEKFNYSKESLNQILPQILNKSIMCVSNEDSLALSFVGYEVDEEVHWIYYEFKKPNKEKINRLIFQNKILTDDIHDQVNIVHMECYDKKATFKLFHDHIRDTLYINS